MYIMDIMTLTVNSRRPRSDVRSPRSTARSPPRIDSSSAIRNLSDRGTTPRMKANEVIPIGRSLNRTGGERRTAHRTRVGRGKRRSLIGRFRWAEKHERTSARSGNAVKDFQIARRPR